MTGNIKQSGTTGKRRLSFSEIEDIIIFFSESIVDKNLEDDVVWDVAGNCISQLGYVDCVIYLFNESKDVLIQKAAFGPKSPRRNKILNPIEIKPGDGITGFVAQTGMAEIIPDTRKDKRYIVDDRRRLSEISVPIMEQQEILGVIDCEHHELNFFNDQDLKILSFIARLCAVKLQSLRIEKANLEKQLKLIEAEKEISKLQMESFYSQLNPHFLFNALNSLQHLIIQNQQKVSLNYISSLGKLIRFNLNKVGEPTIDLSDELESLKLYLSLQELRYENEIVFDYSIKNEELAIKIPSLILQTLLENIIENSPHSIEDPLKINLELFCKEDVLEVKLTSTGNLNNKNKIEPQYRRFLLNWENQIARYSTILGLAIDYHISNNDKSNSILNMKIPNLI